MWEEYPLLGPPAAGFMLQQLLVPVDLPVIGGQFLILGRDFLRHNHLLVDPAAGHCSSTSLFQR
jgi:hypothetical protein